MKSTITNKTWVLAFLLALASLGYGIFEIWIEHGELDEAEQTELARHSINHALQNYSSFESDFVHESNQLLEFTKQRLGTSAQLESIIEEAENEYDFWGVSLFQGNELILWTGFGSQNISTIPDIDASEPFVGIEQNNNVTFLSYRAPLNVQNGSPENSYWLTTRKKLNQENILPIGNSSELDPSVLFSSESDYPVHFSFFNAPPQDPQFITKLSTQSIDSAGVIYTLSEDYSDYRTARQNQFFLYRAIFYALIISLLTLFLISVSTELSEWKSLGLKLFAITLAWFFFSNIEYGVGWLELFDALGQESNSTAAILFKYCIHSFFILLITIACFNTLATIEVELKERAEFIFPIIFFFYGLLSSFLLYFFLFETYTLFVESSIPILDLEVFPGWQTLLFYIASGLISISAITLLSLLAWFLMKLNVDPSFISLFLGLCGFALGLYIMIAKLDLYPEDSLWILFTVAAFFAIILICASLAYTDITLFSQASRLRLLLFFSFIAVCITYIAMYKGYSERLNNQMDRAAQLFIEEEASEAERIVRNLLTNLERSVSGLTARDMIERPAFVENLFTQQTQRLISEEWESFSISTQLVNNEGEIIGEYSSNLDSPAWTRAFNMLSLVIPFQEERIRVENLRPIIRERPLYEANSNYSSFRRAWIPLYESDNSQTRIGWILCSVYREKPQFQKPLRAVIASRGSENWNASISITEYLNGRAARRNIVGIPLELPSYLRLPNQLLQQVKIDSVLYRTTQLGNQSIRELFIANSDQRIIRAATKHPGLENHLFSILRFFFCVLIIGLLVLGSLVWKRDLQLLGHNRRFRDRIIDRFIFASLLCLMTLIAATYYGIKNQNQNSIQDQLLSKLENLTEAVSVHEAQSLNTSQVPLNELSSALDADAALYRNKSIDISTTGQIYSQHLLPRLLPWDVYESIYNKGNNQVTRKAILGNQKLLIGYQPWINEDGEITGIVAIPTFLEAPKFNEQLLSTTSYLLGLYVIIFGLFILGAALLSTQLTAPLEALREGLKKISGGDLKTTLPVKSKDEIGSLTNAYNIMVYRLKDLQEDLAKAEREAAWKEMAQQVAHEIKNPLTPMKLNLQHLERQLNVSDEDFAKMKPQIEKIAANMIGQIESLNKIASDFSKFARPTDQEFKPIEMNELLMSIANLYAAEEKLVIKTNLYKDDLWVNGVKDELRRVFINLVKNAHEAMPGGGVINLTSSYTKEEKMVTISVSDNGEGIPKESKDLVFVPNFSTKSSGTGLGLAITKKIISEHDGEISFTSALNKGTIFTIQLPAVN